MFENHPNGSGCKHRNKGCRFQHQCIMCGGDHGGAFKVMKNGKYKCSWHRRFYRALEELRIDLSTIEELVEQRRYGPITISPPAEFSSPAVISRPPLMVIEELPRTLPASSSVDVVAPPPVYEAFLPEFLLSDDTPPPGTAQRCHAHEHTHARTHTWTHTRRNACGRVNTQSYLRIPTPQIT